MGLVGAALVVSACGSSAEDQRQRDIDGVQREIDRQACAKFTSPADREACRRERGLE